MPFGAEQTDGGIRFALWAPSAKSVTLARGPSRLPMPMIGQGWYKLVDPDAKPGETYGFSIDGSDDLVPDPASRFQPSDDDRRSAILDPCAFDWSDGAWSGRPWSEAVIAEVHVGTATREGTYAALRDRLEHFRDTGITAIELMPIAETPGKRTWGYDGVLPFAPNNAYGSPNDLKAFVDRAHGLGLMVMLDVVYNHFGPSGNFLHAYAKSFFTERHQTPWGSGINFDGETAGDVVREFFIQNALYWLEEYHLDGLRFDAVHAIKDDSERHFLEELADRIRSSFPGRAVHLVLENEHNEASRLARDDDATAPLYDAQWDDDIHHCWHRLLTGEHEGYYGDFGGDTVKRLGRCLAEGFAYQGDYSQNLERDRGELTTGLPPQAFVAFLQNHDQIGNRAHGERLTTLADAKKLQLARAALLLAPQIPMLFMGEEWGATTPFQFFVDFEGDEPLRQAIREGRAREFERFSAFKTSGKPIPDPVSPETFKTSSLDWSDLERAPYVGVLAETRDLLALRHKAVTPLMKSGFIESRYKRLGASGLEVSWRFGDGALRLLANFEAPSLAVATASGETILWASETIQPGKSIELPPWTGVFLLGAIESDSE
jgi:maltooligosyltrehalose trehalohydrolase